MPKDTSAMYIDSWRQLSLLKPGIQGNSKTQAISFKENA